MILMKMIGMFILYKLLDFTFDTAGSLLNKAFNGTFNLLWFLAFIGSVILFIGELHFTVTAISDNRE